MDFTTSAQKYDSFMGRYTRSLAPLFVEAAGVTTGMRVLDVGCGPGGLTEELAVRVGVAEELPWPDDAFDAALASLVVAFMQDAQQGIGEMARVTRPGGTVAA